jgi:flagellar FliJ protein
MTRSERLGPVQKIAENKERDAAKYMGECLRELEEHKKRLDELSLYRDQYSQKFTEAGKSGINVSQLNDYRHFINQLNEAIVHQQQKISETEYEFQQRRTNWTDLHSRSQALDKVATRYRNEETRQADVKEQKMIDERSQYRRNAFDD